MKLIQKLIVASVLGGLAATPGRGAETILFQDNFDTDSSAEWTVFGDSPTDTPDHQIQFAYDYSTNRYTVGGATNNIPQAPNSAGTSRGLRLQVNKDATAENAAVSLYPAGKSFSGNYALRVDLWMNYPGSAKGAGSTGSTELSTFGINHAGTRANWHSTETVGDGVWFAMAGEGGAAQDYRAYEWDGFSVIWRRGLDGGLIGEDELDAVFLERFPQGVFETPGAPGKRWVEVEVAQREGNIIWKIDGYVIAERPNSSPNTQGNIMIGLMDIFSSIASPADQSYVIFDNLRVVQLDSNTPPSVSLAATDATAAEPGTDTGAITLTRTGDSSAALPVNYRVHGSAQSGADFVALSGTLTIPAGQESTTVAVTPLNDNRAEGSETITLSVYGGNLELRNEISATVMLADDNDQTAVTLSLSDPWAYEGIPSDAGSVRLTRVGDTESSLPVNLTIGGSAVSGTDYQPIVSPVIFPAGATSITVTVVPINNTNVNATNRTVTVEVAAGSEYVISSPTNLTINIREDDGMASGTVLFSDDFDTDTSAQWTVNEAHPDSNRATFNFDYGTVGIPPAPNTTNTTTRGLKLEANVGAATFTGLSVSPTGKGFEGDYRLSFDMWINYNGPLPAGGTGSTLSFSAGVGTAGTSAQFPGTSVEGVLFSVTGDGGSGSDWRAYVATGAPLATNSGAYAAGMHSTVLNNSDPHYVPFGRAAAPEAQLSIFPEQTGLVSAGAPGMAWHEVSIERRGTNISWFVDNLRIATITLTNKDISTNIFVGFFDINATQTGNQDLSFGLVDNLRVEQLEAVQPPTEIRISGIIRSNASVQILFSAPASVPNPTIEGSATVTGGFAPEPNVQLESIGAGGGNSIWRATISITTPNRFFRVRQ